MALICVGVLSWMLAACGRDSIPPPVAQNPIPSIASISPSSAPIGSPSFALTVNGANFISGSVVQWGASSRSTTFVSSTQLVAAITAADLLNVDTVTVTVFNPAPGGGTSNGFAFSIVAVPPLSVVTTRLPDAQPGKTYRFALQASGGISPYTWSLSSGVLPGGLSLSGSGLVSGIPAAISGDTSVHFVVQVSDSAAQPNITSRPLSIIWRAGLLGRNDSCGTATPVSNGTIRASISPYGDIDVYAFQGTAGSTVKVETVAQRLIIYGDTGSRDIFLDTFLEILDTGCNRLTFNDDISLGVIMDSMISGYVLPYNGTYYIRISDLRGDGRPDFIYDLTISGAN